METSPTVPPTFKAIAQDLLGLLHKPGGTVPGSFTQSLFELWPKADLDNKARIESGWPEVAFVLRSNDLGGLNAVRSLAGLAPVLGEDAL
ncbi:MAG TPA: hypothetical protein VF867_11575 [Arthrobacter sp.]